MLTAEIIKANPALATLPDEQTNAFIQLYENQHAIDKKKEIDELTGNFWGRLDNDLKEVTGREKPDGVKTHEWNKKIINELKAELEQAKQGAKGDDALKAELERVKNEFSDFKLHATDKADITLKRENDNLKKALQDADKLAETLRGSITKEQKEKEKILSEKELSLVELQTNFAFVEAQRALKFKPSIGETIAKTVIEAEQSKILSSYKPEVTKDKDGKQFIQLRDKVTNEVLLNPANYQNPYTPGDLLTERLSKLDLLDKGRQVGGAGSQPGQAGGTTVATIDAVRSAKTRAEADKGILEFLKGQNITTAHPEFNAKFQQLRAENKVAELPA